MNHFRCFSIDVPSGMDADTGRGMAHCEGSQKTAVKAEFTVTFGAVKPAAPSIVSDPAKIRTLP